MGFPFRRRSPQRGNPSSAMHDTGTPITGRRITPPEREQQICARFCMGSTGNSAEVASQLDVVIDGTWVLVPWVDRDRNIVRVDIYSPQCSHPLGVYFTNQLDPNPWPVSNAFYLLDPHGYAL